MIACEYKYAITAYVNSLPSILKITILHAPFITVQPYKSRYQCNEEKIETNGRSSHP